jgi:gliding motility-associated-like protein
MKPYLSLIVIAFFAHLTTLSAQTEGWSTTCTPNMTPSVSEVMVDACGNEFRSEYVILRTRDAAFDVRDFALRVSNPQTSANVGAVSIISNTLNINALQALNAAAGASCAYGTVFRNAFDQPYNGIIPPNSAILIFNNKDSTEVTPNPQVIARLCGSKVFVVFGVLNPQSPGTSIFRNYSPNGSCGTGGCLRKIEFKLGATYCTQMTYNFSKLTNPNTTNPPAGFGEGSFIAPNADGTINYGGGNLSGNPQTENCMPPERMLCVIPAMPSWGQNRWNVLAFDAPNDYTTANFKGFYVAKDTAATLAPADTINGSFEFNTAAHGWWQTQAPSEAHATDGAAVTYDGCNTKADNFSIQAKREGFPCGYYRLKLMHYDDGCRIRLDANGDGTFELDQTFAAPSCATGCGTEIWSGQLGAKSRMEISAYDLGRNFQVHMVFQKEKTPPSVKISVLATTPTACNAPPTGALSTNVAGGTLPYDISWTGVQPIINGATTASNLAAGIYTMRVLDGLGCKDSVQILVPQINNIQVTALNDTILCPNSTAVLRGSATGGTGALTYNWLTSTSSTVLSNAQNFSVTVSQPTNYVLRVTDGAGCFKTDTVQIATHNLPRVRVTSTSNDTICNDAAPVMLASGATSYTWSAFPQIGASALSIQGNRATLFTLFLPAPNYRFTVTGTDANGCQNTAQTKFWIIPLPRATIQPVMDSLCDDGQPIQIITTSSIPNAPLVASCGTCLVNNTFYPDRAGAGSHFVEIIAQDSFGCRNAPSILIHVKACRCPSLVTQSVFRALCEGDSTRVKTRFYKTSGVYRDSFPRVGLCDSVVILTLNVVKKDTTRLTEYVCDAAQVGTQTRTLRATKPLNCDSVVITNRVLGRKDEMRRNYLLCEGDSVQVGNQWLKMAGQNRVNLTNTEGCDSVIIANITLKRRDYIRRNLFSCDPTRVGTVVQRLTNIVGCDSTVETITTLSLADTTFLTSTTCNPRDTGRVVRPALKNQLGCDSFVIVLTRLKRRDTINQTRLLCQGDSVFVNNSWVKNNGFYPQTFTNTEGCDSTVNLTLNFRKADSIVVNYAICNGDSVRHGTTWYKTAGNFTQRLQSVRGCDSLIFVGIAVKRRDSVAIQQTTCNTTNVGTRIQRFTNSVGCDSIIATITTLQLLDTTKFITTTCDPAQVSTNTRRLTSVNGCDSIVLTQTRLLRRDNINLNRTICSNDSIRFGNQWLKTSGLYSQNLTNTEGCDSAIVLNLRVLRADTTIVDSTTCSRNLVGETLYPRTNRFGCDSLVIVRRRLVQSAIDFDLTVAQPIACQDSAMGILSIQNIRGGTPQYRIAWNTADTSARLPNLRAGTYRVTVSDGLGCEKTDVITLNEPPAIRISMTAVSPRCYGEARGSLRLDSVVNARLPYRVSWQGFTDSVNASSRVFQNVLIGDYRLVLQDANGCVVQKDFIIPEAPERRVSLGSNIVLQQGDSAKLIAILNFTPKTIAWTPKDASLKCDTCLPTTVRPFNTTTYKLVLTDSAGCAISDDITVEIEKKRAIFIPNSFSPNGDGLNDHFTVFSNQEAKQVLTFKVYNRWGSPVFTKDNFLPNVEELGWDGKMSGVALPQDIYTFFALVEFIDGEKVLLRGDVQLMR